MRLLPSRNGRLGALLAAAVILVTAGMFAVGWDDLSRAVQGVSPSRLAGLLLLQVMTLGIVAYQWYFLLRKRSGTIRFREALGVYLSGKLVESLTPSLRLGGEAAQVYLFRRITGVAYEDLTGLLVVRKYTSLVAFFGLCGAALLLSAYVAALPGVVYITFALLALAFAGGWRLWRILGEAGNEPAAGGGLLQRAFSFLKRASASSRDLVSRRDRVVLILTSALVWVLYPVKIYFVAWMLGYNLTPAGALTGTFGAYSIGMLPLLPGGLGTFEGSMAFFLSRYGLSPGQGLAVALVARLATYWFPLLLAGLAASLILRPAGVLKGDKVFHPAEWSGHLQR